MGHAKRKEHSMARKAKSQNPSDKQAPLSGKVENDFNQQGEQVPTQRNEGRRTPESRSDREAHIGGANQNNNRRGQTTHQPNKGR
jgi:hypothetical protein